MRVALYGRISTDKQDTLNQLRQLREFASTQGWKVIREFVDIASGKSGDRAQFKALFAAASQREFDLVLFWSLDRFSREGVFETLKHLQTLTGYGVGYRSFTEQYLGSCGMFKDAVISILAVVAKNEYACRSEPFLAWHEQGLRVGWEAVQGCSATCGNYRVLKGRARACRPSQRRVG